MIFIQFIFLFLFLLFIWHTSHPARQLKLKEECWSGKIDFRNLEILKKNKDPVVKLRPRRRVCTLNVTKSSTKVKYLLNQISKCRIKKMI